MKKVSVNIHNCYGINEMKYDFDVENIPLVLLYSTNGTMKSSFAKIFKDIKNGEKSVDRYFPLRPSVAEIKIDGREITAEEIYVIESYVDLHRPETMSNLLVNRKLKAEYDSLLGEILKKKSILFKSIQEYSGTRGEEQEFLLAFRSPLENLFTLFEKIENDVLKMDIPGRSTIQYGKIRSEKVEKFLESPKAKEKLIAYAEIFENLVGKAQFFKKEFNHYHADTIQKSLDKNGFFDAKHGVFLTDRGGQKIEISNSGELAKIILEEKNKILSDSALLKAFNDFDKLFANEDLREFRDFVLENRELIPELLSPSEFKKRLWISYLQKSGEQFKDLMETYRSKKDKIEKVVEQSNKERTLWQTVLDKFHERFHVPFKVSIENKSEVILNEAGPSIIFTYTDGKEEAVVGRENLVANLSQGERRALYILNILFELEVMFLAEKKIVLVMDDIADSFDYKNKYAIIQYIQEIVRIRPVVCLVLTHNFDFYRTLRLRVSDIKLKSLMAFREKGKVVLKDQEFFTTNPFLRLKKRLEACKGMNRTDLITMIPFVRNLLEYIDGSKNENYQKMTALLHVKENSYKITCVDLAPIFKQVVGVELDTTDATPILQIIQTSAVDMVAKAEDFGLGEKIVLSLAIRLSAEEYMIRKISEKSHVGEIKANQTAVLFRMFSEIFGSSNEVTLVLDQVCLMTPENIHINAFMFEPILDMSTEHLRTLYKKVNALGS